MTNVFYRDTWTISDWGSRPPGLIKSEQINVCEDGRTHIYRFEIEKPNQFDGNFYVNVELIHSQDIPHYVEFTFRIQHHPVNPPQTTTIKRVTFAIEKDSPREYKLITGTPYTSLECEEIMIHYEINHHKQLPRSQSLALKKPQEYTGLIREKSTCYINSVLQVLFHIPVFRDIVFSIPDTNNDRLDRAIPKALQCLFTQMLTKGNYYTKILTDSFGWPPEALLFQHDAEEFLRAFLDKIRQKVANTPLENQINQLFQGTVRERTYRNGVETFRDLDSFVISVSGLTENHAITSGLKAMTDRHQIEGSDVQIESKFLVLPKIIFFHLCRFVFTNLNTIEKINSCVRFPKIINMKEFLDKDAEQENSNYELFAIIAHSGVAQCGHYTAYLRPSVHESWFRFNDTVVNHVDEATAIKGNFGGPRQPNVRQSINPENAYILMYIHVGSLEDILVPEKKVPPPRFALDYAEQQRQSKTKISIEKSKKNSLSFSFLLEEDIATGISNNMIDFKDFKSSLNLEVPLDSKPTSKNLYSIASDKRIRLWRCDRNMIPYNILSIDPPSTLSSYNSIDCHLFMELINDDEPIQLRYGEKILIFVGIYESENSLKYVCKLNILIHAPIKTIIPIIKAKIGILEEDELIVFRHMGNYVINRINNTDSTFHQLDIRSGTFLFVQRSKDLDTFDPSELNVDDMQSISFYKIQNHQEISSMTNVFSMKYDSSILHLIPSGSNGDPAYAIRVPHTFLFIDLKKIIGSIINESAGINDYCFIYPVIRKRCPSIHCIQNKSNGTIAQIIGTNSPIPLFFKLFHNLDRKNQFPIRVLYSDNGITVSRFFQCVFNKDLKLDTVYQFLIENGISAKEEELRILKISHGRIDNLLTFDTKLTKQLKEIRFERIPTEQLGLQTTDFIRVSYGTPHASTIIIPFGHPFLLPINGSSEEIEYRLKQMTLGLLEGETDVKYQFASQSFEIRSDFSLDNIHEAAQANLILYVVVKGIDHSRSHSFISLFEENIRILN